MITMIDQLIRKNFKVYKFFFVLKNTCAKFNIIRFLIYKSEIGKRKNLSIFEYKELSKTMKLYSKTIYSENFFYGNYFTIRKALKNRMKGVFFIEHGIYFGNYVPQYEFNIKAVTIVTFGKHRLKPITQEFNKCLHAGDKINIITIGPYIHYAEGLMSAEQKSAIKKQYGTIMLVFPSHSLDGITVKHDVNTFLEEIEKISISYDSVFICMYWKDIQDGKHEAYLKKGYTVVTAGHINDSSFLSRLKDIIDLSDMTVSNSIGTHIGYCVNREKPHYLYYQKQEYEGEKLETQMKHRSSNEHQQALKEETDEIIDAFSTLNNQIIQNQKMIVEKYWGNPVIEKYEIIKDKNE